MHRALNTLAAHARMQGSYGQRPVEPEPLPSGVPQLESRVLELAKLLKAQQVHTEQQEAEHVQREAERTQREAQLVSRVAHLESVLQRQVIAQVDVNTVAAVSDRLMLLEHSLHEGLTENVDVHQHNAQVSSLIAA